MFRWRKKAPRLGVPTRTPYVWADVAVPPPIEPNSDAATQNLPESPRARGTGRLARIRLGFADGSQLEIDDESENSRALRRLADVILGDRTSR